LDLSPRFTLLKSDTWIYFARVMLARFLHFAVVASAAADCISMSELQKNMPQWVGVVPYSHLVNKTWGYPTDCSGFVSWALQTGKDTKAYEFGAPALSTKIPTDELRYGDIITDVGHCDKKITGYISGHVIFFDKWADDNHTKYWAYESTETENQTPQCQAQRGKLTRSLCFNHHVMKSRSKTIDKWSAGNCTDRKYGYVDGGAHRLSADLLCPAPGW
jgi:hypothetical protein